MGHTKSDHRFFHLKKVGFFFVYGEEKLILSDLKAYLFWINGERCDFIASRHFFFSNFEVNVAELYLHLKVMKECVDALRSDLTYGLSTAEAIRRQKYNGFNEFEITEHEPLWRKYFEQVWSCCAFHASIMGRNVSNMLLWETAELFWVPLDSRWMFGRACYSSVRGLRTVHIPSLSFLICYIESVLFSYSRKWQA